MTIGIYCIENLIDGKRYIGKSTCIRKRWNNHRSLLLKDRYSKGCNRHLYAAVQKYGIENFHFGLIESHLTIDKIHLAERELYWQDWYNSYDSDFGYNMLRESGGVITHSEETKLRLSASRLGIPFTSQHKLNLSIALIKAHLKCEKISRTAEQRKHQSDKMLGVPKSEEHKKNISEALIGVKKSPEHVQAMKVHKRTNEHRRNLARSKTIYSYQQYSISGNLINTFVSIADLLSAGFGSSPVSGVCNGRKITYKGFIWKKILKLEVTEDI